MEIRKGAYLAITLNDWCKEEMLVAKTFQQLLSDKQIAKENGSLSQ
jgi:hypothetical protein